MFCCFAQWLLQQRMSHAEHTHASLAALHAKDFNAAFFPAGYVCCSLVRNPKLTCSKVIFAECIKRL
jgi:hypothetical protein